jgi:hypothetical protein
MSLPIAVSHGPGSHHSTGHGVWSMRWGRHRAVCGDPHPKSVLRGECSAARTASSTRSTEARDFDCVLALRKQPQVESQQRSSVERDHPLCQKSKVSTQKQGDRSRGTADTSATAHPCGARDAPPRERHLRVIQAIFQERIRRRHRPSRRPRAPQARYCSKYCLILCMKTIRSVHRRTQPLWHWPRPSARPQLRASAEPASRAREATPRSARCATVGVA